MPRGRKVHGSPAKPLKGRLLKDGTILIPPTGIDLLRAEMVRLGLPGRITSLGFSHSYRVEVGAETVEGSCLACLTGLRRISPRGARP